MKKGLKQKLSIVLLAIVILLAACSKKSNTDKNYKIIETNGIKTFKNKNLESQKNLTIIPKIKIKVTGNEDQALSIFSKPTSYTVDSKGNIFVLDSKDATVKKFNKSGKFINSFCNKGQGPGEALDPEDIVISQDTVIVIDDDRARTLKFNNNF
jgi:ABC-type uncharacterized transport system auxiliary subunit